MRTFNHLNAKTVNEPVKLLKNNKGKAVVIAGGSDLLGVLKDKILSEYPETVINLKSIPGLDNIKSDTKGLLNDNTAPTEQEVKGALSGNYCRCGSHYQPVKAVMDVAKKGG